MKELRFDICDEVFYLNTASAKIEKCIVKGIQVVPTAMHQDEEGRKCLDGSIVLYQTEDGPVLAETEVFASENDARSFWLNALTL